MASSRRQLGTAHRIATAQRKITYSGVGMETEVQVSDRPVTQQGMMGMRVRRKMIRPSCLFVVVV
jgi:hypothetical protein